ncbi:MAG: F0F1 ATP synthase subunit A [Bacteroidia bacterium]|nr:F0F1 ATP synthase subunit A [Bacteroidia bacterium]
MKKVSVIFSIFIFAFQCYCSEPIEQEEITKGQLSISESHHNKKELNISEIAFEHILDSHSWHLWGEGHQAVSIPLPVILKTKKGLVIFSSSAFHHDIEGKVVVEKEGYRFVNYHEKIFYASESPDPEGRYITTGENHEILNDAPLDFSITKNVTQLLLVAGLMLFLFISMARRYAAMGEKVVPKGSASILEPLIVFIRDEIAIPNIGPKYHKFMPYLLTVFFLILINNIFGLIPIGANVSGNIAFTFVLAVITFLITNISANAGYWKHIFMPPGPVWLWPILIPLEFLGIFTKPFALMIRLFANMSAGHIIIISLIGLIFIFKTIWISPVSVAFALFIDILECLVAFLQAYVFTMLSALFIGSAVAEHEHAEGHH